YVLLRNAFIDEYKINIDDLQKLISNFDFSDDCEVDYRHLYKNIDNMFSDFLKNSSKIEQEDVVDFDNVKELLELCLLMI
ncbi:MAG: hypothetical protein ACRCSG_06205, partial [Cellulosilyticaceae bacterium]